MSIELDFDIQKAEARLEAEGLRLARDSASKMRDVAHSEAREDTGEMKEKLIVVFAPDGAEMQSGAAHSVFEEYGVGRGNERGGRQTKWTYYSDEYGWVTTSGHAGKAFMRPGFAAGVAHFHREKRRRGL